MASSPCPFLIGLVIVAWDGGAGKAHPWKGKAEGKVIGKPGEAGAEREVSRERQAGSVLT
jgi:hypothetical protein